MWPLSAICERVPFGADFFRIETVMLCFRRVVIVQVNKAGFATNSQRTQFRYSSSYTPQLVNFPMAASAGALFTFVGKQLASWYDYGAV